MGNEKGIGLRMWELARWNMIKPTCKMNLHFETGEADCSYNTNLLCHDCKHASFVDEGRQYLDPEAPENKKLDKLM